MKNSITSLKLSGNDSYITWVIQYFIPFIVVLVFLYAGIIISQKFGIAFAGAITSRANKALSFFPRKGWQGTKYVGKAAARKFDRDVLDRMGVSPRTWVQAWKKKGEEREAEVKDAARAKAMARLDKFFGFLAAKQNQKAYTKTRKTKKGLKNTKRNGLQYQHRTLP